MKSIALLLLLLVSGSVASWWAWQRDWREPPQFRDLQAQQGDLVIAVSATGTVEPEEVVDVGAQIIGLIEEFGPDPDRPGKTIDYGSKVTEGAVLGRIDDSPYQAELEKAEANLKVIQADLKRSEAQMKEAQRAFDRAQVLRDTNSGSDYDRAESQFEMAKADVAVSKARVEQAEIQKKQAEINLGFTTIKAPIEGVVIDRRVNVGQTVVAGLNAPSLFLIAKDLKRMQVWAAVNEADIGEIKIGQHVTFKVDAYRDRTFEGTVAQIRLNAGMANNVVTYGVVVDILNEDGALLPYMTANLQFEVDGRKDVLLVPNQALRWRPSPEEITPAKRDQFAVVPTDTDDEPDQPRRTPTAKPTVWVTAPDGLVMPIEVGTGLTDGIFTEVTSGDIRPGTGVVVGVVQKAKRDFVSSFVSRVTGRGKKE
jgi:HlyD family secretion protein